jgi:DNA polymerase II small subunit
MDNGILNVIKERGLILEKDVFDFVKGLEDLNVAESFLEGMEKFSGTKLIGRGVLQKHVGFVKEFISKGGEELERVVVKLGLSMEVKMEKISADIEDNGVKNRDFQIFYSNTGVDKKLEVGDFTGNFRSRYQVLQRILMGRPELNNNLISINKISSDRQGLAIIGIVSEKRITKNKNLIIVFEDLTGKISSLVKFDNEDVFSKANELQLDDIVGVKGSGNKDMLFVHDIFFPDSFKPDKVRFDNDVSVAFLSDVHAGSDRFLKEGLEKFIQWINSDNKDAKGVRYIFFSGDNVDGVGVFPGQENVLSLKTMEEQYELLASFLKRIPKHIEIFMCPGQHDACRVAEPQPPISKKYGAVLYDIENLNLVSNPTLVKIFEGDKEFKVLMYHGASIHGLINEIKELRLSKAHQTPAKAIKEMLKRRHLAPTHGNVVYIPNKERDPLVITDVPDVLCTGEVHRLDIDNYNGVMIITGSCWQAKTPFEEKVGNIPDPCKVPVLNLKSRGLKIYDFSVEEELAKWM